LITQKYAVIAGTRSARRTETEPAVAEPAAAEPAIDWIVLRPDRAGEPSGEGFAFR
jgi:hypothetical protein